MRVPDFRRLVVGTAVRRFGIGLGAVGPAACPSSSTAHRPDRAVPDTIRTRIAATEGTSAWDAFYIA
jgi:hypothetical protein